MQSLQKTVNIGRYTFQIIDNTLSMRDQIYCRNFKIGGNNLDCVNVSIKYNENKPISGYIPHILYDPDCSDEFPLYLCSSKLPTQSADLNGKDNSYHALEKCEGVERGQGSVIMIKTLLNYIHEQIPTITEIDFEDKSNIECATEYEIKNKSSRFRKKGTNIYPIPLYYFSIAFNGQTWYEKNFNARQKNIEKHKKYKEKINNLLYSQEEKENTSFLQFLQIAQPPIEIIDQLENYYNKSITFGDFFQSIPKMDRCKLVRDWISTFMSYHLRDVFENSDWIIELPFRITNGGRKNTRKYYCPKGRIIHNKTYKDFGIDVTNE